MIHSNFMSEGLTIRYILGGILLRDGHLLELAPDILAGASVNAPAKNEKHQSKFGGCDLMGTGQVLFKHCKIQAL